MTEDPLMIQPSGIRGIAGSTVTPELVRRYVRGLVWLLETAPLPGAPADKAVVIGRDARKSGPQLENVAAETLLDCGYDVCNIGLVPTPTVQLATNHRGFSAGIIVTSSHNPEQWNGLKFVDSNGIFVTPERMFKLFDAVASGEVEEWAGRQRFKTGTTMPTFSAIEMHCDLIHALPIFQNMPQTPDIHVVVDACNSAGSVAVPKILESFGARVTRLYCSPTGDGIFPRGAEPLPVNLADLGTEVRRVHADFGVAVDPDSDRCVLVDETGNAITEDYTLAIAVDVILHNHGARRDRPIVINLSTSAAVADVAQRYGVETVRSPVGENYVAIKALEVGAELAGEGNGGVMYGKLHFGRDAPLAASLALLWRVQGAQPFSHLVDGLPKWHMHRSRKDIPPAVRASYKVENRIEPIKAKMGAPKCENREDGVLYVWEKEWLAVRPSNTEPIIRSFAESSESAEKAKELAEEGLELALKDLI